MANVNNEPLATQNVNFNASNSTQKKDTKPNPFINVNSTGLLRHRTTNAGSK